MTDGLDYFSKRHVSKHLEDVMFNKIVPRPSHRERKDCDALRLFQDEKTFFYTLQPGDREIQAGSKTLDDTKVFDYNPFTDMHAVVPDVHQDAKILDIDFVENIEKTKVYDKYGSHQNIEPVFVSSFRQGPTNNKPKSKNGPNTDSNNNF